MTNADSSKCRLSMDILETSMSYIALNSSVFALGFTSTFQKRYDAERRTTNDARTTV